MSNHFLSCLNRAQEGGACTNVVNKSQMIKLDSVPSTSNDKEMVRLTLTTEFQQRMIDELSSEIGKMEVNFRVQNAMKDVELASLREQFEQYQRRIQELEDISPPRDVQPEFGPLQNTSNIAVEKKEGTEETFNKISDLDYRLTEGFVNSPAAVASPGRKNETNKTFIESDNPLKSIRLDDKYTDLCLVTSAVLDKESAIADFVDPSQKPAVSIDVTSNGNEKSTCKVTPQPVSHSVLKTVSENERVGVVTTAVNYKNEKHTKREMELELNPIRVLEELCMDRKWIMPRYKFVETGRSDSGTSVTCSVNTCKVQVDGRSKKTAKQNAARMMYNTVKNIISSNVVPLVNSSDENVPTENKLSKGNAMFVDSSMVTSAGLVDEKANAANVVRKSAEADQVLLQVHRNNKPTDMFENNTGHKSTTKTNPFDLGVELTSVDAPKGNVTCTDKNSCQVTAGIAGRSEFREVKAHERMGVVDTAVNCIKKQSGENTKLGTYFKCGPIGALQELCMLRKWKNPKYEFFKEGDSKCFSYSAECTVLEYTMRVEGQMKKDAKRQLAEMMYHKVKNVTYSSDVLLEKISEKNVASTCTEENFLTVTHKPIGHGKLEPVHKHKSIGTVDTTAVNSIKKQCTENANVEAYFKFGSICALQELCIERHWILPSYEFFQVGSGNRGSFFSVKCTVNTCTVSAEGHSKKAAKHQVAAMMYQTLKNT